MPFETVPPCPKWMRCRTCESDTADCEYDVAFYSNNFSERCTALSGGIERCREQVRGNAEWFNRFADSALSRTFLDVGCGDGAMLDVMQDHGWAVHGWDVSAPHYFGPHVTVSSVFAADLFPIRYAAINCREVIEHCPDPARLLEEVRRACLPGGLVQVQTPVPCDRLDLCVYSSGHLFVASVERMKSMLANSGLEVIEELHWGGDRQPGQAYLCRR